MDVVKLSTYEALSPFEIKDFLIKRWQDASTPRRYRSSMRAAEIPTGLRRHRAMPSFCSVSLQWPKAGVCSICRRGSAECPRQPESPIDSGLGSRKIHRAPAHRFFWRCFPGLSTTSSSMRIASCTSSSIPSSATTIRFPTGCSSIMKSSSVNICSGRCAAFRGPKERSSYTRSKAAPPRCATYSSL